MARRRCAACSNDMKKKLSAARFQLSGNPIRRRSWLSLKAQSSKLKAGRRGFAVLLSVLILAAVGMALSTALLYLTIGGTETSLALSESQEANGLANTCAESALEKLAASASYTGTASLTVGAGTCTAVVISNGSSDSIDSTGTVGSTIRKVEIKIGIPQLTVSSWQELGDFN
jgi:hypothetical protein